MENALEAAVRYHNRSYNSYLGCSPLFKLTKTSPVLPADEELKLHCPFYETEKSQIMQNLYRQRTKFYFNSRKKALPPEMNIDDYILVRHQKVGKEWKLSGPHRVTRVTKMDGHPKYVEYESDDKTPRTAHISNIQPYLHRHPRRDKALQVGKLTCIKFCVKNEIKCADAFRMLTVAYGKATLDRSNVFR
ncbi:hypothetical protein LAZ67_12001916 [Cordylochernes scorpioides]|uniref:Uncharacterized protein n=1 Tax=Cordylochernes scorpioides TaxID=51811 RepID=A0ABY6L1E6_9ARAC|nr:hypothetical protein LAZ67_12001916 [Cordylochernes scorpioides]